MGWEGVEMKRGAVEKILEVPEVEDSKIFGQFLVIIFFSSSCSGSILVRVTIGLTSLLSPLGTVGGGDRVHRGGDMILPSPN